MGQNPNNRILTALRNIKDSGGPTTPVRSLPRPSAVIGGRSKSQVFEEKVLPSNDNEPLAQHGVLNALVGHGQPKSDLPSMEDVGSMAPAMGAIQGLKKSLPVIAPEAYEHVKAGGMRLYSRLTDSFAKAPQTMKPAKAMDIARKGASKEEISYRKLEDFLRPRNPMDDVRREDIMGHLGQNPIELDVVRKGGPETSAKQAYNQFLHEMDTKYGGNWYGTDSPDADQFANRGGTLISPEENARLTELRNAGKESGTFDSGSTPQWPSLQTPGPKENYGETLINLPEDASLRKWREDRAKLNATPNDAPGYEAEYNRLTNEPQANEAFHSSHWDEPNNLVWSRHNERALENPVAAPSLHDEPYKNMRLGDIPPGPGMGGTNKGRFIEEIQSDWERQGRDFGFKGVDNPADFWETPVQVLPGLWDAQHKWVVDEFTGKPHNISSIRAQTLEEALAEIIDISGVPDMPYKAAPHELSLKEQLLDAANDPELEWLGVADADNVSRMEGHHTMREGTELWYDQKHPSALKRLLNPLGGDVQHDNLPPNKIGDDVKWGPAPGHRDAIEIGFPGRGTNSGVEPVVTALPGHNHHSEAASYLAGQIKDRVIPGGGMWKANLPPELKALIRERGFPAMMALLGLSGISYDEQ